MRLKTRTVTRCVTRVGILPPLTVTHRVTVLTLYRERQRKAAKVYIILKDAKPSLFVTRRKRAEKSGAGREHRRRKAD